MSTQQLLQTKYGGACSIHLPPLSIVGAPRSGRRIENTNESITKEERRLRNTWRREIVEAVRNYEHEIAAGLLPIRNECNLYATFYLDGTLSADGDSRYMRLDLDNLLKPLQDTLKNKIIEDDRMFRGVKVRKEPVRGSAEERVELSVITTRTLLINAVEHIAGDLIIPYWKSRMQLVQVTDEDGQNGMFVDHTPNAFLRDEYENKFQYRDVVPGYDWHAYVGKQVAGCMVVKRTHHLTQEARENKNIAGKLRRVFWLHKWSW